VRLALAKQSQANSQTVKDQEQTMSRFSVKTKDGFEIALTHFIPQTRKRETPAPQLVLIAGATGVPQQFYRRFATALAEQGYQSITMDYRGIGLSRTTSSLRGFQADFMDWAEQDVPAVLDWMLSRGQVSVVGHSFGGHAFGLLDRANETKGIYSFATGAGWSGYMPFAERLRVEFLWKLMGPVTTGVLGYMPGKAIGGEDLPLGVYRQWRKWCANPKYWFDDPSFERREKFSKVVVPVAFSNSKDDLWALPASAAAFQSGYTSAQTELISYAPQEFGLKAIGHMGYFRSLVGNVLWPKVFDWLDRVNAA
jgi:predicted alpha/beta hydrolase